jgi:hypothetical protein
MDPGEVFLRMRTEALTGEDDDTGWIEFGADPDFRPTVAPLPLVESDWTQIARANPSYPDDTPREAILRMRKKLGPESFLREGLGIWDEDLLNVLPMWRACATAETPPPPVVIGLAVSLDLEFGSIAAGAQWPDGRIHVGSVERRAGTEWLVTEAKRIQGEHNCVVVMDEKCPDASLLKALREAEVNVRTVNLEGYIEACSELVKRVKAKVITHSRTTELDNAVKAAAWRMVNDRKVWGRKQSSEDISMLEAATFAAWVARSSYNPLLSVY